MEYTVYIKANSGGYIIAINSSAFLAVTTGWVEIDSGNGDRYHHAQGNYFEKPIRTPGGAFRYKLVEGRPVECTEQEIAAQEEALRPVPTPTLEDRVGTLEATTEEHGVTMDDLILIMADFIGGE